MTEPTPIEPHYSTADVAQLCAITRRRAQTICRDVLGVRSRYWLTKAEYDRVAQRHRQDRRCAEHRGYRSV